MAQYVYPAVFHPNEDDGSFTVIFPDLPGCITEGKSLSNAIFMAEDALAMWLWYNERDNAAIPPPSDTVSVDPPEFVTLIAADTIDWCQKNDGRAVKKTLSIPNWLNTRAERAGINFSQILQDALKERLGFQ